MEERSNKKFWVPLALLVPVAVLFFVSNYLFSRHAKDETAEQEKGTPPPLEEEWLWGQFRMLDPDQKLLYESIIKDIRYGLKIKKPNRKDMVLIPAGEAIIGAEHHPQGDEQSLSLKQRQVPAFYIDKTEVSNAQYVKCVEAKQCLPVDKLDHIENDDAPDRPAILPFMKAKRYCLWAGKRLPTEVEWEKAARSTDGRLYPWGNEAPTPDRANICGARCPVPLADPSWTENYPYTGPIGSFPSGNSPYGLVDVAGNVKEWVESVEPLSQGQFIAKGASWYSPKEELFTFYRQIWQVGVRVDDKGVRCAADASIKK